MNDDGGRDRTVRRAATDPPGAGSAGSGSARGRAAAHSEDAASDDAHLAEPDAENHHQGDTGPEAAGSTVAPGPDGGQRRTTDAGGEDGPVRREAAVTGATYGVLFMLGVLVGVYGSFYYAMSIAIVPLGAVVAVVANFVMCWAAGRMMRTGLAALLPAVGWLVTVILLSSTRAEGDYLVTSTASGWAFLLGGTVAAATAVAMSFARRARATDVPTNSDESTPG